MQPLWKLRSGNFAGWNSNGLLYNSNGDHVGYFIDSLAFDCNGRAVGEMYDDRFIGYRTNIAYPIGGTIARNVGISVMGYVGYVGNPVLGWDDPKF